MNNIDMRYAEPPTSRTIFTKSIESATDGAKW